MYVHYCNYIYNPSRLPQPRSALRIPAPVAPLPSQPWISQNFCKGFLLQRPCEICSCRRNGTQRWASCNFSIVICDILCVPLRTIMSVSIILIENQRRESARSRAREERERESGRWAFCDQCRCRMVPNPRHQFQYITDGVHFSCSNM